ncbi:PAS domain S-box protein [Candidatus Contubernalis alkaliaceticus]|uniref:PAS domain S-box protein n=1 Tax=Candidatus Contubernalis alkaliaceticus TaxID=338645 RepID=UPI001F4C3F49|nr:PAS domain S-box protein [Candidatus Contubernalis alkalaceticus]UNC91631.1 PAS domain S-box protein [Candidatus Contubernalis alkalaceticus]
MGQESDRYRSLIENMPDAFAYHRIIMDDSGNPVNYEFIDVNHAFEKMTGLKRENIIGKKVTELPPGTDDFSFDYMGNYGRIALTGGTIYIEQNSEFLGWHYEVTAYSEKDNYFSVVFRDITDRKEKEERIKELNCLHNFSRLLRKEKYNLEKILREAVNLLPPYFQNSQEVCVRIVLNGREFQSPNYKTTPWKIVSFIELQGEQMGFIEVCSSKPSRQEKSPFLKEEELMLTTVAEHLGRVIDQEYAEESIRKSEEYLSITLNSIGDAVITTDENGFVVRMNPVAEKLCGWSCLEAKGKPLSDVFQIINSETRKPVSDPVKVVLEKGEIVGLANHTALISREGSEYQIADSAAPIVNNEKRIVGVVLVFRDVSEEYGLRKDIKESELRWQFALEGAGDGVWDWNAQTDEVFFSRQWKKMLGYEEHEVGSTLQEWDKRIHPEDKKACYEDLEKHFSGQTSVYQSEHRVLCKDGTYKWILDRGKVIKWTKEGKPLRVIGIHSDITKRKQVEDNLKKSEKEKSLILNAMSERISYLDSKYQVIWANRLAAESVDMKLEELTGKMCYELWYQKDEPCSGCPIQNAYDTKQPQEGEVITPDGRCWFVRGYPVLDHEQGLIGVIKLGQDITEKKGMDLDLKDSEQRFRSLVELAPDAIFVQADKQFVYVNQAAVNLFGAESREQLIGTPVMERFHPDYHQQVLQRIKILNQKKEPVPWLEQVYLKLDGTSVDVEVAAVPIRFASRDGALVYIRDITERKRKEQKKMYELALLRQQQKLEAIGVLASGVAHEINNPINGIMNYGQLLLDNEEPGSTNAKYLGEIIDECERVSSIVQNLLQFARHEKQSHSPAQVKDIITKTLLLIDSVFRKEQIVLEVTIPEGLPSIKCRSQQIQQVLMNLLTNARDSLNVRFPGYHVNKIIKIICSHIIKDGRRWIRITVEDCGTGIPESIHEKLYEPFFTTKIREQGTGLGLAISYGIVKEHNGHISFETKVESFTKFYLDLPVDNGWAIESVEE